MNDQKEKEISGQKEKQMKQMQRQAILAAIVECAERLGSVPTQPQLTKMAGYTKVQVRRHFGSYSAALRECKLEKGGCGWKVPQEKLLQDWANVVRALKRVPSMSEYAQFSDYSHTPLVTRFGSWGQVPQGVKQCVKEEGWAVEWKDVLEIIDSHQRAESGRKRPGRRRLSGLGARFSQSEGNGEERVPSDASGQSIYGGALDGTAYGQVKAARTLQDRKIYGPLLVRPFPLTHGPTNEKGVIFLFGAMAEKLGFVVLHLQAGYPDGEAMRLVGEDCWQRIRIEFEYESRNFLKHMHEVKKCDLIVCWKHNWPECPLEVLELKTLLPKLP